MELFVVYTNSWKICEISGKDVVIGTIIFYNFFLKGLNNMKKMATCRTLYLKFRFHVYYRNVIF